MRKLPVGVESNDLRIIALACAAVGAKLHGEEDQAQRVWEQLRVEDNAGNLLKSVCMHMIDMLKELDHGR